jgi:hypothetical protein
MNWLTDEENLVRFEPRLILLIALPLLLLLLPFLLAVFALLGARLSFVVNFHAVVFR